MLMIVIKCAATLVLSFNLTFAGMTLCVELIHAGFSRLAYAAAITTAAAVVLGRHLFIP